MWVLINSFRETQAHEIYVGQIIYKKQGVYLFLKVKKQYKNHLVTSIDCYTYYYLPP